MTKNGRKLTVESRIELVETDGRRLVFESARDITERKHWEQRQQLLLGELTHRVRNTLTVVQAIAHQTLKTSESNKEFVELFDGRLVALGNAHGLLVESQWRGASLAALARRTLEPYILKQPDKLRLAGPAVILPADIATPFALVLHELATNAARYGSLSDENGTINLRWTLNALNGPPLLTVVWEELGGPTVQTPKQQGFGSSLIASGIPGAKVEHKFQPRGLVCKIELSMPKVVEDEARE